MIPLFLLNWAAKAGIPERFRKDAVVAVFVVLVLAAIVIGVKVHDHNVIKQHEATQDAANTKANQKADNHAAEQRRVDDARSTQEQQQVKEAINEAGSDPAARRAAYYRCVGLQQSARANRQQPPEC